jgi:hypothetical protein
MRAPLLAVLPLCLASCARPSAHSLAGEWLRPATDGPLGTFLVLRDDATFTMGDVQDGERFTGLSGTWRADADRLTLTVRTSESCKVGEGRQIRFRFRLLGDDTCELTGLGTEDKALFRRSRASRGPG